jgi:hypothetical protein
MIYLLDIFLLVFFGNFNVLTIWYQVKGDHLAKSIVISREGQVENISDIVLTSTELIDVLGNYIHIFPHLQHPHQTSVEIGINTLHVRNCYFLSDHHLVKRDDEEGIQEATVENCQTNNSTDESEVVKMFRVDS